MTYHWWSVPIRLPLATQRPLTELLVLSSFHIRMFSRYKSGLVAGVSADCYTAIHRSNRLFSGGTNCRGLLPDSAMSLRSCQSRCMLAVDASFGNDVNGVACHLCDVAVWCLWHVGPSRWFCVVTVRGKEANGDCRSKHERFGCVLVVQFCRTSVAPWKS